MLVNTSDLLLTEETTTYAEKYWGASTGLPTGTILGIRPILLVKDSRKEEKKSEVGTKELKP